MSMATYEQVMDDLAKGQEFATQLQGLLRDSPKAGHIMDQILHTFSRAIHAAKAAAAASASAGESEVTDGASSGGKRKSIAGGGPRKASRTRTQDSSVVTKNMRSLEDGQTWRKYGQKEIQNSKQSKAFCRWPHEEKQQHMGCRQAQHFDDQLDTFKVINICVSTSGGTATAKVNRALLLTSTAAGCSFIRFAPTVAHVASTCTSPTNTTPVYEEAATGAGLQLSGLKLEGGDLERVLSRRTPVRSALYGAEAAAAAWPDQGEVTSPLQYGGAGALEQIFDLDGYPYLEDLPPYDLAH
nr:WRKY70 [Triticum turgidum subsp. durum]